MNGGRVLIVEDDPAAQDALAAALTAGGVPVVRAANGCEALRYLASGAPVALIVLDLMMPVLDGWGVLSALQQDPELAAIPVVVMSDVAHDQRSRRLPAVFQCAKPFSLDVFVSLIQTVLTAPRQPAV